MSYRQSNIDKSLTEIYAKQVTRSEFTEDPDPRNFLERQTDRAIAAMLKEPADLPELLDILDYLRWACGASGRYREKETVLRIHDRIRDFGMTDREGDVEALRKVRRSVGEVMRR